MSCELAGDGPLQRVLGPHDHLADLASGPSPAGSARDVVDALAHELRRFGHARGKTATREHRQVHPVIAHVSGGGRGGARLAEQAFEGDTLVPGPLFDERDAEFRGAHFDGARAARGKYGDFDPAFLQHLQPVAVARVECLQLGSGLAEVQGPVCEHAVDIEDHQPQPPYPLQNVVAHQMTLARNRSPSVNIPTIFFPRSRIAVIPMLFLDISASMSEKESVSYTAGTSSPVRMTS